MDLGEKARPLQPGPQAAPVGEAVSVADADVASAAAAVTTENSEDFTESALRGPGEDSSLACTKVPKYGAQGSATGHEAHDSKRS